MGNEEGLKMKLAGHKSFFLVSKDNRKPLQEAVIKALLPTDKEAPKLGKKEKKDDGKKDAPKAEPPKAAAEAPKPAAEAPKPAAAPPPAPKAEPAPEPEAEEAATNEDDAGDEASPNEGDEGSLDVEMVQQTQCCGGLKKSAVCSLL